MPTASTTSIFVRRLAPFLRPETGCYVLGVFLMAAGLGTSMLFPQALRMLIDEGIVSGEAARIGEFAAGLAVLVVVSAIATYARTLVLKRSAHRATGRIRRHLFSILIRKDLAFFDSQRAAELSARIGIDTEQAYALLGRVLPEGVFYGLMAAAAGVFMIWTTPVLGAIVLIASPVFVWGAARLGRDLRIRAAQHGMRAAESAARASEVFASIETVRVLDQEAGEERRFGKMVSETTAAGTRVARLAAWPEALTSAASYAAILVTVCIGGVLIAQGRLTQGALAGFVMYALMAVRGLGNVVHAAAELHRTQGAMDRLFELVHGEAAARADGVVVPEEVAGVLHFRDVHFRYPSRPDQPVLRGVELTLRPGEVTAIVGPTGAGKSTLVKLAGRLYEPQIGRIELDGCALRELQTSWLRRQVTLVSADSALMASTVADNIGYAFQDATREQIVRAARIAGAHAFIEGLPNGYDTDLGDRGLRLSSGQRQRIALARAVLLGAKVIFLDEATSGVDAQTERPIREALRSLPERPTVVVVAHRLSTVADADRVVMLADGRVLAEGKHLELLQRSLPYRRLVAEQLVTEPEASACPSAA